MKVTLFGSGPRNSGRSMLTVFYKDLLNILFSFLSLTGSFLCVSSNGHLTIRAGLFKALIA